MYICEHVVTYLKFILHILRVRQIPRDKLGRVVLEPCKKRLVHCPVYVIYCTVVYTGQVKYYKLRETHGHV